MNSIPSSPIIAIDAMGGDAGTEEVVKACQIALQRNPDIQLVLVGDSARLTQCLADLNLQTDSRLSIKPSTEVIEMTDSPATVLRNKKDASMRVAIDLVAAGTADACVSAGNTGALMALSRLILKMLPGIDRPAICTAVPNKHGHVHWLDLGANVDSSPEQLYQFALMGNALCNVVDDVDAPKIGLLNIGSEAIKGNEPVKKAAEIISASGLNYIGFVEGDDIYCGKAVDVVVCDGFVGNIALKTSEGLAHLIKELLKQEFTGSWYGKLAAVLSLPVLKRVTQRIDPGRYNGASLLGLDGIVIKSHGGADAKSYANAIHIAVLEVKQQLPSQIKQQLINAQTASAESSPESSPEQSKSTDKTSS